MISKPEKHEKMLASTVGGNTPSVILAGKRERRATSERKGITHKEALEWVNARYSKLLKRLSKM